MDVATLFVRINDASGQARIENEQKTHPLTQVVLTCLLRLPSAD